MNFPENTLTKESLEKIYLDVKEYSKSIFNNKPKIQNVTGAPSSWQTVQKLRNNGGFSMTNSFPSNKDKIIVMNMDITALPNNQRDTVNLICETLNNPSPINERIFSIKDESFLSKLIMGLFYSHYKIYVAKKVENLVKCYYDQQLLNEYEKYAEEQNGKDVLFVHSTYLELKRKMKNDSNFNSMLEVYKVVITL